MRAAFGFAARRSSFGVRRCFLSLSLSSTNQKSRFRASCLLSRQYLTQLPPLLGRLSSGVAGINTAASWSLIVGRRRRRRRVSLRASRDEARRGVELHSSAAVILDELQAELPPSRRTC